MTKSEARAKAFTVKWKTEQPNLWSVVPSRRIIYSRGHGFYAPLYILRDLSKELADHIVKLHNESL